MDRNLAADTSAPVVRRMSGVGCRAYRTPPPHRFKNPSRNSATQMRFIPCALLMVGRVRSQTPAAPSGAVFSSEMLSELGEAEKASAIPTELDSQCQMLSNCDSGPTHGSTHDVDVNQSSRRTLGPA